MGLSGPCSGAAQLKFSRLRSCIFETSSGCRAAFRSQSPGFDAPVALGQLFRSQSPRVALEQHLNFRVSSRPGAAFSRFGVLSIKYRTNWLAAASRGCNTLRAHLKHSLNI